MLRFYCILLIAFQLNYKTFGNLRWLSYEKFPTNEIWEKNEVCSKKYGLSGKQVRFCRKTFPYMTFVQEASKDTREECQHQLKDQKWNCLSLNKVPTLDVDLKKNTREASFVYALSAASLAIAVSRGCMAGQIKECSCYHTKRQVSFPSEIINEKDLSNIDNMLPCKGITKIGKEFTMKFTGLGFRTKMKNEEQQKDIAIKKHNIKTGLNVLGNKEEITCVCNGATAGCAIKFCHRRIVRFEDAALKLVNKYKNAIKLTDTDFKRKNTTKNLNNKRKIIYSISEKYDQDLIYTKDNNDVCEEGKTSRRRCVLDETKTNSCKNLCCGKGHQEKVIEISAQCRCKFVFCCKVVCDTCRSMKRVFECL